LIVLPSKVVASSEASAGGKVKTRRFPQLEKAPLPIDVSECERFSSTKPEQSVKALSPIAESDCGRLSCTKPEHLKKASLPIVVRE
jgi:hypothetical protein